MSRSPKAPAPDRADSNAVETPPPNRDAEPGSGDSAQPLSFEESSRRLTQIVEELEGGDLPLERSLELFEEGVRLARTAQERLDRAERRVEELLGFDAQGKPIVREFES